ncbi:Uncharacterised protein [Yersinia enterocolitica]|nr:Uncharacterised protein [Yersinia enterocolitica]
MFNFEIGFIPDVTEAQCASIQCVFIGCCGRCNHRPIKLGMFADGDIKTTFACEDAGLFLHRVKVAVHFVAAGIDAGTAGHGTEIEAATDTGVLLLRIITVTVLLTLQQQVTAHIGLDGFTADLCTLQYRIAATGDVELVTGIDRRFSMSQAVAAFAAFALVQTGGDINAPAALTGTYSYPQ